LQHPGGAREEHYTLLDITKARQSDTSATILEEVEVSRAMFEIYEGAVVRFLFYGWLKLRASPQFIHQGLTFIVKEVSHDLKVAKLIRAEVNWITSPRYVQFYL
jgi:Distinct helicase family with a unique C-terminal domain including a metal-binding cysteine cluster